MIPEPGELVHAHRSDQAWPRRVTTRPWLVLDVLPSRFGPVVLVEDPVEHPDDYVPWTLASWLWQFRPVAAPAEQLTLEEAVR